MEPSLGDLRLFLISEIEGEDSLPALPVTLIKGDTHGSETDYRDNLPVNMYAVERKLLGADGYMIGYPGLTSLGTGSGIDRGGHYNEKFSDQYRVSGGQLISVAADGATVELGAISGAGQAAMPYSFNTQAVIADGRMWLYDTTAGFREITDADLGNPLDGVWVNGYYFLTDGDFIYHTLLTNESSVDPLQFATAEFMPDPSTGVGKTQDNKVMVFGRYTIEYFADVANPNFAFTRIEERAQKIGIVATHAKCESKGRWFIAGGGKMDSVSVHVLEHGSSQKISTREIDKIIGQYTEPQLSDMRMECRQEDSVTFILIHLPNETLCFNATIAGTLGASVAWSILKTDVAGNAAYRAINGVFDARAARWVYGDKRDASIGLLDNSVSTHYGLISEWILFTPFLDLETASIDEIEIETIPGFTTTTDATVAFSLTFDGVSFGMEHWMDYGDPNEHSQRFLKRRLGYVGDWVGFKFRGASTSRMAFALMTLVYS